MKSIKYICLSLTMGILASCSGDFLDKEPLGVLSTATLSDSTVLNMAVNRLYGSINWREFGLGRQQFGTHEACADDFVSGTTADFSNLFANYTYLASNGWVQQYWDRTYQNLHYCNLVIDNARKSNASASTADLYEAQGKFFRAYYHFDLTNVFGDAPMRDHDPQPDEYNIPKNSRADIISLVISDLEFAIAHLPTRSQWGASGLGRITKGTAQGLLAKVYLYERNYTKAKEYAELVVNGGEYSLFSSYRDFFSPDNLYCAENMMPGGFKYNTAIWTGRWYSPYLQWQGLSGWTGANAGLVPSQSLYDEYESGDPRQKASLLIKGVNDTIPGYNNNLPVTANFTQTGATVKYANRKIIWPYSYWNGNNFSFQNVNPVFMRYADIVLIAAEASNELNDAGTAKTYLEQIRFRARGNKTFATSVSAGENGGAGVLPEITSADKATLRLAIWHERRVELAMEFNRWFDLVRYEKVADANGNDGSGYTTNLLKNVYGRTNFDYDKFSRFPIPSAYITSSNGVLVQNPNW